MANRADKRRIAKADEALIRKGIDPSRQPTQQQVAALVRRAYEAVREAIRLKKVDGINAFAHSQIDMAGTYSRDLEIACRKGCSHCCNVWVAAAPQEIFHFAKTYPKAMLSDFKDRLVAAHANYGNASFDERGEMSAPCPALVDNQCSNYQNRPLVCRTATSVDADLCRRAYVNLSGEDLKVPAVDIIRRSTVSGSVHAAIGYAGLHHHSVEFTGGLKIAIEDASAETRWLSGEDVFADVPHDPVAPGEEQAAVGLALWAIEKLGDQ